MGGVGSLDNRAQLNDGWANNKTKTWQESFTNAWVERMTSLGTSHLAAVVEKKMAFSRWPACAGSWVLVRGSCTPGSWILVPPPSLLPPIQICRGSMQIQSANLPTLWIVSFPLHNAYTLVEFLTSEGSLSI